MMMNILETILAIVYTFLHYSLDSLFQLD